MKPRSTPDGRYLIVNGRLWRATNPNLPEVERKQLVGELMAARRGVRAALRADDRDALEQARANVQRAKEGLGERGAPWWQDGARDLNRVLVSSSPYADWWYGRESS